MRALFLFISFLLYPFLFSMTPAKAGAETGQSGTAQARIEQSRKADCTVKIIDPFSGPVEKADVLIEQTRHAFLFGCNAFRLFQLGPDYEKRFSALFNYATLPFYWKGYEPQRGRTEDASRKQMADWCRANNILAKGHPLVWSAGDNLPTWIPQDVGGMRDAIKARITDIVSKFSGLIDIWDVVNEATCTDENDNAITKWILIDGPAPMVGTCLSWARAANPNALLLYNDWNLWNRERSYEELARNLVQSGQPIGAFGIQSHMHQGEWTMDWTWRACDTYGRFGRPIHFTEVTVISGQHGWMLPDWPTTPEGEAFQADYVEDFYTLLFSHPSVQAITWWDLTDGEWMGAPGGLLRKDLTPKPAYDRLLKLIKNDWWSRAELRTDSGGIASFRGFLGTYRLIVKTNDGGARGEFELRPGNNLVQIELVHAPLNFRADRVLNRSLFSVEYINVLKWEPNPRNIRVVKYRIYQTRGEDRDLLAELDSNILEYRHRKIEKAASYTYALVAVSDKGLESDAVLATTR